MNKITLNNTPLIPNLFQDFLMAKKVEGITAKTIQGYRCHFTALQRFYNFNVPITDFTTNTIVEIKNNMLNSTLAPASVASYIRTLKSFFSWAKQEGYTDVVVKLYHCPEIHKDTYKDEELLVLLQKPKKDCSFAEYRDWVIISFIMSCGARASTIRNIQNRDVDFTNNTIFYRHTKNKKPQYIPMASNIQIILKAYMRIRQGTDTDYLFCGDCGEQLTENGLYTTIKRYNLSRGVSKTSIHLFRHSFAQRFIKDCGGNVFMLQELLGHSSLDMSKHYFAEYGVDIAKNFDDYCPLNKLVKNNRKIKK